MSDYATESEALAEIYTDETATHVKSRSRNNPSKGQKLVNNSGRYRCLVSGCNPVLRGSVQATEHSEETGHRTAKWPVRSAEGKARARLRNKTGYYDKYNVGAKSYGARQHLI